MKTTLQQLISEIDAKLDLCTNVDQIATATFIRKKAKQLLEVERKEYVNFGNYARHPVNAMITVDGLFTKTFKND
jgi:hypothetical protein